MTVIDWEQYVNNNYAEIDSRTLYWSVYKGWIKTVIGAINFKQIPPTTKCYKGRNLLTAAILGRKEMMIDFFLK